MTGEPPKPSCHFSIKLKKSAYSISSRHIKQKIQYNQRQVFHIHRSTSLECQNNDTIKFSHTCGKFFFKGLCRSVCRCRAVQIRRITVMIGLHMVVDACGRGCSIIKRKPVLLSFLEHNSKGVLFVPMSKLNKE